MSFGTNLQFLRKYRNMTQEELAEQLNVSRQSVSKWESDAAFPEMDTLLTLCGLFSCDLDTLLRSDVSRLFGTDTAGYDRHMNRFARSITAGVALVLSGVALMTILAGLGDDGTVGALIFLALLTVAVAMFIVSGIDHGAFVKKHPIIEPFYTQEQIDRYDRRFPLLIAIPVALILLGVLATAALALCEPPAGLAPDWWECLEASALLLAVAIAAPTLTWAGIQKAKYDVASYNRESIPTPTDRRVSALWGCGMVAATAVYVGLGLAMDLWDRAWIIYPVAALACVAGTIFLRRNSEE